MLVNKFNRGCEPLTEAACLGTELERLLKSIQFRQRFFMRCLRLLTVLISQARSVRPDLFSKVNAGEQGCKSPLSMFYDMRVVLTFFVFKADGMNVEEEVKRLKAQSRQLRKRSYSRRKSRLDRYGGEIVALRNAGATCAEIQRWLREKRIKVHRTTVSRYLAKIGNG